MINVGHPQRFASPQLLYAPLFSANKQEVPCLLTSDQIIHSVIKHWKRFFQINDMILLRDRIGMLPFSDSNNEFDAKVNTRFKAFDAWILLPFISPKFKVGIFYSELGYAPPIRLITNYNELKQHLPNVTISVSIFTKMNLTLYHNLLFTTSKLC